MGLTSVNCGIQEDQLLNVLVLGVNITWLPLRSHNAATVCKYNNIGNLIHDMDVASLKLIIYGDNFKLTRPSYTAVCRPVLANL